MKIDPKKKSVFTPLLLKWFRSNHRPLPWKGIKDPYLIWLSEIILQQTRVEQGLPYYEKFKEHYPRVQDLAAAPEDEVMKLWEGLGYYSRARNLHTTAKFITNELHAEFPNDYKSILSLKGVGPYTAAAIASFAFDLPYAVVDGNVYRVLARHFGIEKEVDSTEGKKFFAQLAQELLDKKNPADYNQAIMDFGATQCVPKSPNCSSCPLANSCYAFRQMSVQQFPRKGKKIKKRTRYFNFLVFNMGNHVFIVKRLGKDIWKNLYQFPLIESDQLISDFEELCAEKNFTEVESLSEMKSTEITNSELQWVNKSKPFQQVLTHQKIIAQFWEFEIKSDSFFKKNTFVKVLRKNLSKFAFPKIIDLYLQDNSLYLELY